MDIGDSIPEFDLPASNRDKITNRDLLGKWAVIYFYPKDDTPGCTKQAINFSVSQSDFDTMNAYILGISKDSVSKHVKFTQKHDLTITLGSDETGEICESFGCWVEKSMYGKTYMGIERSTFLVDPEGKVRQIWRKVKVPGHIENVLQALKEQINHD